jgi:hypothetical protein
VTVALGIDRVGALNYLSGLGGPNSPNHNRYLTALEFMSKFGPSQTKIGALNSTLAALGLPPAKLEWGNRLGFATTIGTVERIFGVHENVYRYGNVTFFANQNEPSVPLAIASNVGSIEGLNNYSAPTLLTQVVQGNTSVIPADVLGYYQVQSLLNHGGNASGMKIGIMGGPGHAIQLADVTNFWTSYGIPWYFVMEAAVEGGLPAPGGPGDAYALEMTLDAEWSGAIGQTANITIVTDNAPWWEFKSENTQMYDEMSYLVSKVNPQIISTSIEAGINDLTQNDITNWDNLLIQAADQGIAVVAASGDGGFNRAHSDSPKLPDTSYPMIAGDSHVMAIGGITDFLNQSTPGIMGQQGWSFGDVSWDPNEASTGANVSYFSQPSFQSIYTIKAVQNGYRDTPDISFPASPSVAVYFNGAWVKIVGTSAAAPMFAGVLADIGHYIIQSGNSEFFNNQLYSIGYGSGLQDVTEGNNTMLAGPGWDYVTGIGVPKVWGLASILATEFRASPSLSTTLSQLTIPLGGSVYDTATLSGEENTPIGTATGTVTYYYYSGSSCSGTGTVVSTVHLSRTLSGGVYVPIIPQSSSVTFNIAGSYSWLASYSGDQNDSPASSPCEPLTVNKMNPTISTTLSLTTISPGGSVYDQATLSGATSTAGGTVTYQYYSGACSGSSTQVGPPVTVTNGVVPNSNSATFNTPGHYYWFATYSGDSNNNGVTSPCEPLTVKTNPSISTTLSSTTILVGGSVYDTATLSGVTSNAGGTVTYEYFSGGSCAGSSTQVGSPVTVTNGVVPNSAYQTFNAGGSYSWNAIYSGDGNNNGATSPCEPLTVNKRSPTISTSLSSTVITAGGSVYDTSWLTGATGDAGGTVTYYYSTSSTCPAGNPTTVNTVTVTNGVVPNSNSKTFPNAGTYYWYATYSGDSKNNGNTSPCEPLTVNPPQQYYYLTMSHYGSGSTSPASGNYLAGSHVTISATPAGGYKFCYWDGTGTGSYSGTSRSYTITMGGPITETANFYVTCPQHPTSSQNSSLGILAFPIAVLTCLPLVSECVKLSRRSEQAEGFLCEIVPFMLSV